MKGTSETAELRTIGFMIPADAQYVWVKTSPRAGQIDPRGIKVRSNFQGHETDLDTFIETLKANYNYSTAKVNTVPTAYTTAMENKVKEKVPDAPTTDGTYILKCTVSSGTPTYSWESA